MSNEDYFRCLDRAATATDSHTVRRVRTEVLERWRGDPRAEELAEALTAHEGRLEERETERGSRGRQTEPRLEQSRVQRTHLGSPIANWQSLRSGR